MSSTGTKKKRVGGLYFVGGAPLILGVFLCNLGCYNGNGFTELCALAADVGPPVNQEVGKKLHQVVASWSREGGCRRFCHLEGGPLQQPARRRACSAFWTGPTDFSRCSTLQRGSSATGGSMTTSRLSSVMFSTGCQSHSASSTSSVYSSFNHYTWLLPSICEIAALQLIPPRPGYSCDHLRGLIYVYEG